MLLEHLFGSKTRVRLLRVLFRTPERSFYVRELARLLEVQINAIRREIETLAIAGLLLEVEGKPESMAKAGATLRKYYRVNTECPIYPELQALLAKEQLTGEGDFAREVEVKVGNLDLLLVTGRFTRDSGAATDILLVGVVKERVLEKLVAEYEKKLGFQIRYTIMTRQEFQDRRYVMDKFIFSLFEANHILAVNRLDISR